MRAVQNSRDLQRIAALPVAAPDPPDLVEVMTKYLHLPTSDDLLFLPQARALAALAERRGLLCSLPVGAGKTLISLLAGTVLEAKRPVLLLPADLRRKTLIEARGYAQSWRLTLPKMVSYQLLGQAQHADLLDKLDPDLLICDEAHFLRNRQAAVTRRVARFLKQNQIPTVILTGTAVTSSILDICHLSRWALRDGSPLPLNTGTAHQWAQAMDHNVSYSKRQAPGALKILYNDEEKRMRPLDAVRSAVGRRIVSTPGVVAAQARYEGVPLTLRGVKPDIDQLRLEALSDLRGSWELPNGEMAEDPKDFARHALTLACGFYYRWNPEPPEEWRLARSAWTSISRDLLGRHKEGLDSPKQVRDFVASHGTPCQVSALLTWESIKPTFEPQSEPVWISRQPLQEAAEWLWRHDRGIVWTPYVAFGEALAEVSYRPYFGRGGSCTKTGQPIEKASGAAIASVLSNKTGRNLQHAWSDSLVVAPSPSGAVWEQLIGRTHREGQTQPVVVEVWQSTEEQRAAWTRATKSAAFEQAIEGQDKKLCYCTLEGGLER